MKTLLTYIPLFGCSAMMVVCLVVMCGSRLWRRTPAALSNPAPVAVDDSRPDAPSGVPVEVLAELAALRSEVAELRRSAPPARVETEAPAARG
jgi:hypothetical protein